MAEKPLLLFPTPEIADRTKGHGFPGRIHRPAYDVQGRRLSPIFRELQNTFRLQFQQTPAGIDPEQVLIIEVVGGVDNFANAVRRIDGLEWMGEIEADEIAPDDLFYNEDYPEKSLGGRLYLILTNQAALTQMLSLWEHYQQDQEMIFEYGLTKFRDVFLWLKTMRPWGVQDRFEETGIIESWQEDLNIEGYEMISFETELWFRNNEVKRQESFARVESLIQQLGGQAKSQCIIPQITYHSILTELPRRNIQDLVAHQDTELVKCDNIMFFRPTGQMSAGRLPIEGDLPEFEFDGIPPTNTVPVIALLDGLPLQNHTLLQGRLIIDDPDDWSDIYPPIDRVHGTAMSSLIAHGDLNNGDRPLERPIYVRPIMQPDARDFRTPRDEHIPNEVLAVDLIHRSVRRLFENDGDDEQTYPSIKVINLSIGDPSRQFNQVLSPLARLLDWLSIQYNLLFILSAGNQKNPIGIPHSPEDFANFSPRERENVVVKSLYEDIRHRKLLSPAESMNSLTVGAFHYDTAAIDRLGGRIDLFERELPSPISSFGSGYRRSIKPDVVYSGGRMLYHDPQLGQDPVFLRPAISHAAPGNLAASPGTSPGDLNKTMYCTGTSNSAALISRAAGICYDSLIDIFGDQAPDIDYQPFVVPLLKAMIVHGCSWGDVGNRLNNILAASGNNNQIKNWISQWLGYGAPDISKVLDCTKQRATILGLGQLEDEEAHLFSLPLPPSLGALRERRRLTVTLAWLSPIAANTQKYRSANLWFELENSEVANSRRDAYWRAARRGTVQHEVFEGQRAVPVHEGDAIQIKVNCRRDASRFTNPIRYGLAVSLEVAEGIDVFIYNEIRERILPAIPIVPRDDT